MRNFISWLLFIAAFILFGCSIATIAILFVLHPESFLDEGYAGYKAGSIILGCLGWAFFVISVILPDPEGYADTFMYYFNRIF